LKEVFSRHNVDGSDSLQVVHLVCASDQQIKEAKKLPGREGIRNRQQPSSRLDFYGQSFIFEI
jgi:hypothetical protein